MANDETNSVNEQVHKLMNRGCWHEYDDDILCKHCGVFVNERHGDGENPSYDSDLNAAMEVVEWMRKEKGLMFYIHCGADNWFVRLGDTVTVKESLPRAICAAIIAAVGETK